MTSNSIFFDVSNNSTAAHEDPNEIVSRVLCNVALDIANRQKDTLSEMLRSLQQQMELYDLSHTPKRRQPRHTVSHALRNLVDALRATDVHTATMSELTACITCCAEYASDIETLSKQQAECKTANVGFQISSCGTTLLLHCAKSELTHAVHAVCQFEQQSEHVHVSGAPFKDTYDKVINHLEGTDHSLNKNNKQMFKAEADALKVAHDENSHNASHYEQGIEKLLNTVLARINYERIKNKYKGYLDYFFQSTDDVNVQQHEQGKKIMQQFFRTLTNASELDKTIDETKNRLQNLRIYIDQLNAPAHNMPDTQHYTYGAMAAELLYITQQINKRSTELIKHYTTLYEQSWMKVTTERSLRQLNLLHTPLQVSDFVCCLHDTDVQELVKIDIMRDRRLGGNKITYDQDYERLQYRRNLIKFKILKQLKNSASDTFSTYLQHKHPYAQANKMVLLAKHLRSNGMTHTDNTDVNMTELCDKVKNIFSYFHFGQHVIKPLQEYLANATHDQFFKFDDNPDKYVCTINSNPPNGSVYTNSSVRLQYIDVNQNSFEYDFYFEARATPNCVKLVEILVQWKNHVTSQVQANDLQSENLYDMCVYLVPDVQNSDDNVAGPINISSLQIDFNSPSLQQVIIKTGVNQPRDICKMFACILDQLIVDAQKIHTNISNAYAEFDKLYHSTTHLLAFELGLNQNMLKLDNSDQTEDAYDAVTLEDFHKLLQYLQQYTDVFTEQLDRIQQQYTDPHTDEQKDEFVTRVSHKLQNVIATAGEDILASSFDIGTFVGLMQTLGSMISMYKTQ